MLRADRRADRPVVISLIGDGVVVHQQGTPYFDCGATATTTGTSTVDLVIWVFGANMIRAHIQVLKVIRQKHGLL